MKVKQSPALGNVAVLAAGPWYRRLRLSTGLILFIYVFSHFINHATGNISFETMEAVLSLQKQIWQSPPGTVLLYGALVVHAALGIVSLYTRRYAGWTPTDIVQLVLGLCVPPLLANHIAVTRGALLIFGLDKAYAQELATLWVLRPALGAIQVALLSVAWCHGCIGLHTAFRLKRWYEPWRSVSLAAAVLLPCVALLGFVSGARDVARRMQVPAWQAAYLDTAHVGTEAQTASLFAARNMFIGGYAALVAVVLLARLPRAWHASRRRSIVIRYPDGQVARIAAGLSVLDASRMIDIPHASVCGGRGRCSTCRVRVRPSSPGQTLDLPPPAASEVAVLRRLAADPLLVRLACQLRPRSDVLVQPLVPPDLAGAFIVGRNLQHLGEERFVVVMFIDLHGSTALVEGRLPFDAVFLLRRFIEVATQAVVGAGGLAGQFTGDGILALFGVTHDPVSACRQALNALLQLDVDMLALADATPPDDAVTLRYSVGMAAGPAVVGEVAVHQHLTLTALGEVVHTASRLQSATRTLGCDAVVDEAVFDKAGTSWPMPRLPALRLRGRDAPVAVRLVRLGQNAARAKTLKV